MHRVYNSAFMNMLRDEKNQEYRLVIKNTQQFEPEILKRYVNFMNNPDEKTAAEQFGKGDKYFGILAMMITNPGLPMLGHGQIEGFHEKYGMEYRRAYYDETPDEWLVKRHEKEIFPLVRKRYLFAEVKDFLLYDYYTPEGYVNEDVYAYSNRYEEERALVLFHNKYAETRGWIRISTPFPIKGEGEERSYIQKSLAEGLGLDYDANSYVIFRDQISGLEYLRNCQELHNVGYYIELKGYEYHVFLDFRQVKDDESRQYARLAEYLQGGGVPDMHEALQELSLRDLLTPYRELVSAGWYRWAIENRLQVASQKVETESLSLNPEEQVRLEPVLEESEHKSLRIFNEIHKLGKGTGDPEEAAQQTRQEILLALSLPVLQRWFGKPAQTGKLKAALEFLQAGPGGQAELATGNLLVWASLLSWTLNHRLSQAALEENDPEQNRSWMDEYLLAKTNTRALVELSIEPGTAARQVELVKLLLSQQDWYKARQSEPVTAHLALQSWLKDGIVQQFINSNRFEGILWFNKESFDQLLWWMFSIAVLQIAAPLSEAPEQASQVAKAIQDVYALILKLHEAEGKSDFQVEKLLEASKSK
jgi:hypothetical protein